VDLASFDKLHKELMPVAITEHKHFEYTADEVLELLTQVIYLALEKYLITSIKQVVSIAVLFGFLQLCLTLIISLSQN